MVDLKRVCRLAAFAGLACVGAAAFVSYKYFVSDGCGNVAGMALGCGLGFLCNVVWRLRFYKILGVLPLRNMTRLLSPMWLRNLTMISGMAWTAA